MEREFSNRDAFIAFVRASLRSLPFSLSDEQIELVADAFADACRRPSRPKPGSSHEEGDGHSLIADVGPWCWVIRSEDLKSVDGFLDVAGFGVPVVFAVPGDPMTKLIAAALVGGAKVLVPMALHMCRKGILLDPKERVIVLILAAAPEGLSEDGLLANLQGHDPAWTLSELQGRLESLSKRRAPDGTVIPLVAADGNKVWAINGL